MATKKKKTVFTVSSLVSFAPLTGEEIAFYVEACRPYDKAGAYGVQEWIGYIGVKSVNGSFYNVMGLPTQRLYEELKKF
jgi:septum formation protein